MTARSRVLDEIIAEESDGGRSRTKDAVLTGALKFQQCGVCGGVGTIEL